MKAVYKNFRVRSLLLPYATILFTAWMLSMVQVMPDKPLLLAERISPGLGWIQVFLTALYAGIVAWKMQDPAKSGKWRRITWTLFAAWFFLQLILGMINEMFLMSGKLHLPIPMMIIAGPLYRGELSIMTVLFISTILLSGPAWCSHLCYFGALDQLNASKGEPSGRIRHRGAIKVSVLVLVIISALLLRWLKVPTRITTPLALAFGAGGLLVMLLYSGKEGKMLHCLTWCPVGTIVNYTRFINPFKLEIEDSCTSCMRCTTSCRYDALNREDILARKPGITCTLCGDCVSSCRHSSIRYKFFALPPQKARSLYLFISISLHALCMAMGRI